jgi:hypothetical protein
MRKSKFTDNQIMDAVKLFDAYLIFAQKWESALPHSTNVDLHMPELTFH